MGREKKKEKCLFLFKSYEAARTVSNALSKVNKREQQYVSNRNFLPQFVMHFFCITSGSSGLSDPCPDSAICLHPLARNSGRNEQ